MGASAAGVNAERALPCLQLVRARLTDDQHIHPATGTEPIKAIDGSEGRIAGCQLRLWRLKIP